MNRDSQNSMVPTEGSDKYAGQRTGEEPGAQDRLYWLELLNRIARPVLTALAERRLKLDMPNESNGGEREHYAYLEAFGRLMAGIAPSIPIHRYLLQVAVFFICAILIHLRPSPGICCHYGAKK